MKAFYFTLFLFFGFIITGLQAFAACSGGETELVVDIQLQAPTLAWETYWEVKNYKTDEIVLTGSNGESGNYCLPSNGCYSFVIYDIPGDGLCCTANGNGGSYAIYYDNELINTGAEFTGSEFTGPFGCATGTACSSPFTITEGTYSTPFAETWYSFSPTQSGLYRISSCFNSNVCNTAIWAYDYCENLNYTNNLEASIKFSANGCNDNNLAATQVNFITGQEYYIRIGHLETCNSSIIWKLEYTAPVTDCNDPNACNYNPLTEISDPLACQYEGGNDNCAGPDFRIDEEALINSLYISDFQSSPNDCYLEEGCVNGIGDRRVLRFDTKIYNDGSEDFYLGTPNDENPLWVFDECHQHYHFENYAEYVLFDDNNSPLPIGFKTGYCMEDSGCPNLGDYKFGCNVQGLTSGCYDLYAADTKCQWIDITDVPVGKYTMVVRVNWEQKSDSLGRYEQDYSNNWAQVCFELFRDAENEPFFEVIDQCDILVDCYGDAYGDAKPDCKGNCNGNALIADVTENGVYQQKRFYRFSRACFGKSTIR